MIDQGSGLPQIDTSIAHPARMYDYFLAGFGTLVSNPSSFSL